MWLVFQPLIIFAVVASNIHSQFTTTFAASVIGVFLAAVLTGAISKHVLEPRAARKAGVAVIEE